ncbi:MAG: hypothetical protein CMO26_14935 [Thiotrichales bacterium]|nr:hypothetical protein [Thiotrichales bacterium]
MSAANSARAVTVIGAGAVGMACACYLQRDGHRVRVIDRLAPGEACSFGNSGAFGTTHIEPLATPGTLLQVPAWLLDPLGPLRVRFSHLPAMLPFLWHMLRASTPARLTAIATAQAELLRRSYEAWATLLGEAGLSDRVIHHGAINVYPNKQALHADADRWALQSRLGCAVEHLDADDLDKLEPALDGRFKYGVRQPDWRRVRDPFDIVDGLATHFQRNGGELVRATASEVDIGPDGPRGVRTNRGYHLATEVIVAAGAWSTRLSDRLGNPVPLESGRGYNVTLPHAALEFDHLIVSRDKVKFTLSSLSVGLRVGGALEFAGVDAPPDYRRAKAALASIRRVFPEVNTEDHAMWCGDRPMTPDTVPVISPSPGVKGLYYAFGHGHLGLTMGAVTGKLIAELVAGREPSIDLSSYRVDRF